MAKTNRGQRSKSVGEYLAPGKPEEKMWKGKSKGMKRDSQGNNCDVLGTDWEAAGYIRTSTPIELKKRELAEAKLINPDESQRMMDQNKRLRNRGPVKPI